VLAGAAFAIGAGLAIPGVAAVTAQTAAAQAKTQRDAAQTTLGGIYTEAQVTRGEETYYASCVSCHPKGTYAGPSFKTTWGDRPLSDLYDWILNKMPKNDPGTLTPEQSVDVIAYILKENGMPAGKTKMPADEAALKAIRIQLR
jgi:S-disulfanyl-L-cysteine oxidoreductase SoxD